MAPLNFTLSKAIVTVAAGIALVLIASATTAYVSMFGATPISSQDHWGQFGDYFGGLLNPLFAMLAFLALLWSITLQAQEFRSASALLSSQAESAREQLSLLKRDRVREDLLHIIKDIDKRLDQFLELNVSSAGSNPQVTVGLLLSEARRIANGGGDSPAYSEFVRLAQTPGTVVEAPVREAIYLVGQMRSFLEQYSHFESGSYSPMIVYYANKCYRLLDMLEDIGGLPNDSRRFFATVSDPHG